MRRVQSEKALSGAAGFEAADRRILLWNMLKAAKRPLTQYVVYSEWGHKFAGVPEVRVRPCLTRVCASHTLGWRAQRIMFRFGFEICAAWGLEIYLR